MPKTMNLNVRVTGSLKDFVASNIGEEGDYDNVSEYIRNLIRKDKDSADQAAFETLKAELKLAFSVPDSDYVALTADDIISRKLR